jgi:hypothetical protein
MGRTHLPLFPIITPSPRRLRYHYYEGPGLPSEFNHVLRTDLGSQNFTDRHGMSIFLFSLTDSPNLRTDWPKFEASLKAGLPSNPDLPNEMAIDSSFNELSNAISKDDRPHYQVC